jgi:hypothetical protein
MFVKYLISGCTPAPLFVAANGIQLALAAAGCLSVLVGSPPSRGPSASETPRPVHFGKGFERA